MTIYRKFVWLVVALPLALSACAGVSSQGQSRIISVTGTGSVRLAPDIVLITLGVQTQDVDIAKAVEENNRRAQAVMDAIHAAGIADEDVGTVNLNVWGQEGFDQQGNPTGEITYHVDNILSVTLREPAKLGELLQSALDRGANSVQGVTYSVDDPSNALDGARRNALEDAHDQAEQLASTTGVTLGKVKSVSDSGAIPGPIEAAYYGKGGGGAGVPTESGTLEYQVQVFVVYEIR